MLENLMSVDDICRKLGIGKNTAYAIVKTVKHIKIGKKIYVLDCDLEEYIKTKFEG